VGSAKNEFGALIILSRPIMFYSKTIKNSALDNMIVSDCVSPSPKGAGAEPSRPLYKSATVYRWIACLPMVYKLCPVVDQQYVPLGAGHIFVAPIV